MDTPRPLYMAPIMKTADMLNVLAELQLPQPFTAGDLEDPQPDKTSELFEALVDRLMGVRLEELRQPGLKAMDVFQHPRLHDHSVGVLAAVRHVYALAEACRVPHFQLKDVYAPDAKRLSVVLSEVLNFAKHFLQEEQEWKELHASLADQREVLAQLGGALTEKARPREERRPRRNGRLREERRRSRPSRQSAELRKLNAQNRSAQPRRAALQTEVAGLTQRSVAAGAARDGARSRVTHAKAESHDAGARAAAAAASLADAEAEHSRLSLQVVSDPAGATSAQAESEAAVAAARAATTAAQQKVAAVSDRVACLRSLEGGAVAALRAAEAASSAAASRKAASHVFKAAKAQLSAEESAAWQLAADVEALGRAVALQRDAAQREATADDLRVDDARAAAAAAAEEAAAAEGREASHAARVAHLGCVAETAEREAAAKRAGLAAAAANAQRTVDALASAVDGYKAGLVAACGGENGEGEEEEWGAFGALPTPAR